MGLEAPPCYLGGDIVHGEYKEATIRAEAEVFCGLLSNDRMGSLVFGWHCLTFGTLWMTK